MEFEIQKQKQQMPIYWEQSVGGAQVENSNMNKENEDHEIIKPQMKSTKDEEQMKHPTVNIISILELQVTNKLVGNNCKSGEFGMQRFKDDLLKVLVEST